MSVPDPPPLRITTTSLPDGELGQLYTQRLLGTGATLPYPARDWEWHEVSTVGQRDSDYIRGRCRHLETVPVESVVTGDLLAQLCLTCDGQLPPSLSL